MSPNTTEKNKRMTESILISIQEASELSGVPVNTLRYWRQKSMGPKSASFGGKVKYRRAEFIDWIDSQFAA